MQYANFVPIIPPFNSEIILSIITYKFKDFLWDSWSKDVFSEIEILPVVGKFTPGTRNYGKKYMPNAQLIKLFNQLFHMLATLARQSKVATK